VPGPINNTATVFSPTADPDNTNNEDIEVTDVGAAYRGGMIQFSRWQGQTPDLNPPAPDTEETVVWTPQHVCVSPPMPTAPANPVLTQEIFDPTGQPITGTHGIVAWSARVPDPITMPPNDWEVSHVVIFTANHVWLHERLAALAGLPDCVEVFGNNVPIAGARGALAYRTNVVNEYSPREFLVWTATQVFRVTPGVAPGAPGMPAGVAVANVQEVFLPGPGNVPMPGVVGATAYAEVNANGPWGGVPRLALWRQPGLDGVFIHDIQSSQTFEVFSPDPPPNDHIVNPQQVIPYRRTPFGGGLAETELYIRTPNDVLRRPALAAGAIGTQRFLRPNGTHIIGARGVVPFERTPPTPGYTEVLIWDDTAVLLWSEQPNLQQPNPMTTVAFNTPAAGVQQNIANVQGVVVYLNSGQLGNPPAWQQWTEIAMWTPAHVYLHATPLHYPPAMNPPPMNPLGTLEVVGPLPLGGPLANIRGGQAYPRVENGMHVGMELLLWGTGDVFLHERYNDPANNPLGGMTQRVMTPPAGNPPQNNPITLARGAAAVTRVVTVGNQPPPARTQVVIWRQGNVFLLDAPKPPAPANAPTVELLTPPPAPAPIANIWGCLFETTVYHGEANELWLWSPEQVLLQRDGNLVTINVLAPPAPGTPIATPDPPGPLASLAVNYDCVPRGIYDFNYTNPPPLNPPPFTGGPLDLGAGFQGPPAFAPVVRTMFSGPLGSSPLSPGQNVNADVFVTDGAPTQRSSVQYVTGHGERQQERAAIIGPEIVASVVPQCGCIYFIAPAVADAPAPPPIAPLVFNGVSITLSFWAQPGVVYFIEYKDSLNDPAWTRLQTVLGTGTTVTVTDKPNQPSRFYRLRIVL
jgi:hypothetical protein